MVKSVYIFLHVVAIGFYLLSTFFAFIFFLPVYLVVIFVGYDIWIKLKEKTSARVKYGVALLVGACEAITFILFSWLQLKLMGWLLGGSELSPGEGFIPYLVFGFILVSFL